MKLQQYPFEPQFGIGDSATIIAWIITKVEKFDYIDTGRFGNDHSKHEQLFTHRMDPIKFIVVVHWAHHLPMHE